MHSTGLNCKLKKSSGKIRLSENMVLSLAQTREGYFKSKLLIAQEMRKES